MLANVNRDILLYSLIAITIIAGLVIVGGTIIAIVKSYKQGNHSKRNAILTSLLCVVVAGFSWIFNMGWIRFIMKERNLVRSEDLLLVR